MPIRHERMKALDGRFGVVVKKIKVTEASLAAQQEHNQLMKEHQEMLLFTSNTEQPTRFLTNIWESGESERLKD